MATQGVRTTTSVFEADGLGDIVDVAYDHFGLRAAVCSRETVAVFEKAQALNSDSWELRASWQCVSNTEGQGEREVHRGYLRKVCWAHAEFGQVVASASFDGFVCIWSEADAKEARGDGDSGDGGDVAMAGASTSGNGDGGSGDGGWRLASSFKASRSACLDLGFAPPQYGLRLALSFQDGAVKFFNALDTFRCADWKLVQAFEMGSGSGTTEVCHKICWRPFSQDMPEMILIGGSRQAAVLIFESDLDRWSQVAELAATEGPAPVSDVAWASACGKANELVAFASGKVAYIAEVRDALDHLEVTTVARCEHGAAVFQVEWNRLGTTLATSAGDGSVRLWRPDLTNEWQEMAQIN